MINHFIVINYRNFFKLLFITARYNQLKVNDMKQIENNIINSFRLAKTDIIKTQKSVIEISRTQEKMLEMLDELKAEVSKLKGKTDKEIATKTIIKKTVGRKSMLYVSAKEGSKYHVEACPFAKNIKPKHKVTYKSQTSAKNAGKKPCACVK